MALKEYLLVVDLRESQITFGGSRRELVLVLQTIQHIYTLRKLTLYVRTWVVLKADESESVPYREELGSAEAQTKGEAEWQIKEPAGRAVVRQSQPDHVPLELVRWLEKLMIDDEKLFIDDDKSKT